LLTASLTTRASWPDSTTKRDLLPVGRQLGAQFVDHAPVTSADRLAQGSDHLP